MYNPVYLWLKRESHTWGPSLVSLSYYLRRRFEVIEEPVLSLLLGLADFGFSATFVTDRTAVLRLRNLFINGVPLLISKIKKSVS